MIDIEALKLVFQNWPFFALLVWVLYWLFKYYIPARELQYKETLTSIENTFKDTLKQIVDTFRDNTWEITKRLDKIETTLEINNK
jgi:hypothetical protein